jgi:ABC-type spermidine/putrescine transport system permease subunit II
VLPASALDTAAGAAEAPPRRALLPAFLAGLPRAGLVLFALLVYAFLYAPVIVMAIFSFNDSPVQSLPLHGFTTQWYSNLGSDEPMKDALVYSLEVSAIAVSTSVVVGMGFALFFTRVRFPGAHLLQLLLTIPVILPGMVLGISLLLSLRLIGIHPGLLAIVVAHVTFLVPIVVFVVSQRLKALDPSLEQASMDLGAGRARTFLHVTLPSVRVALLAAALLSFTVSFDEVAVTFFVAGFRQTLPVHIWTLLRFGFSPAVNAILTIIAVASVASIAVSTIALLRTRRPAT